MSLPALAALLAGLAFVGATDPIVAGDRAGFAAVVVLLLAATWAAGVAVGAHRRLADELAEGARELDRRRERRAALAVELERRRLAGEVEHAVRGRLEGIVALAAGGDRRAFGAIENSARESLNEMRRLLGVLRSDVAATTEALPTLAGLEELVREAGPRATPARLTVQGRVDDLPAAVQVAACRVVEHGLEAIGAPASSVVVRRHAAGVEVRVQGPLEDGTDAAAALAAVRERVAAHGGELREDGPRAGERCLRAWLPTAGAHG